MTDKQLYVKYGGSEVSNASNILINHALDSKDMMTFTLANQDNAITATWTARQNLYIEAWERNSGTLQFAGWISSIEATNPLKVISLGYIAPLDWYPLTEEQTKTVADGPGLVGTVSTDKITCCTDEGLDPGWTEDQWNPANEPYFVVISDISNDDDTSAQTAITGTTIVDGSAQGGTTYANTTAQDGTYWFIQSGANHLCTAKVKLGAMAIVKTATIKQIQIPLVLYFSLNKDDLEITNRTARLDVYWSTDGTTESKLIGSSNLMSVNLLHLSDAQYLTIQPEIVLSEVDNTNQTYLTQGETNWNNGWLIFKTVIVGGNCSGYYTQLKIDYCKAVYTYRSGTFDQIIRKIKDTSGDGFTLYAYADDGTSDFNFSAANVAVDDQWTIVKSIDRLINNAFIIPTVLNKQINHNTLYSTAFTQDVVGVSGLAYLRQLLEYLDNHYWTDYTEISTTEPTIMTSAEEDMVSSGVTYDDSNDPPSHYSTIEYPDNEYGGVQIFFKNGMTPVIKATTDPSSNPKVKILIKKNVLTLSEAINQATILANRLKAKAPAVSLSWNYLPANIPQVGMLYTLTLPGSYSFTDILCRSVSVSQDGALGPWAITASFGAGKTPAAEHIGMRLADLEWKQRENQGFDLTAAQSPVTRYNQLAGIPTSFTPASHGNEKHSATYQVDNLETSALDTSTTKYPCNNVVKAAMDLKAPLDSPTFTTLLKLANNVPIKWRNAANDADLECLKMDTSNVLQIGADAASVNIPKSLAIGQSRIYADSNSLSLVSTAGGKHVYMSFYPDGVDGSRGAYIGYSYDGTDRLTIASEKGPLELTPKAGTNIILNNAPKIANVANGTDANDVVNKSQLDLKASADNPHFTGAINFYDSTNNLRESLKVDSSNRLHVGDGTYGHFSKNAKYDAEGDHKGFYALRWGTSGIAAGWTNVGLASYAAIQTSIGTHIYPLAFTANGASQYATYAFTSTANVYVSCWFRITSASVGSYINLRLDTASQARIIFTSSGTIQFYVNTTTNTFGTYIADTWYHICIAFNSGASTSVYIDGVLSNTITAASSNVNKIYWFNSNTVTSYCDALYIGTSLDEAMASLHDGQVQAKGFWDLTNHCAIPNFAEPWTEVSSFSNSWVNHSSEYQSARYRRIGSVVYIEGLIKNGTVSSTVFTLPLGYRPAKRLIFGDDTDGARRFDVLANGDVTVMSGSNVWISINCEFGVE